MVVQHNLQAMNANRLLGVTTTKQGKSTEKLSSGYRINRAADDAAGLSISEKMRRQIRGLNQASSNAQDGISSVQTAEGALNEVHDMLQRMNELANQAANGTNSAADRQTIQDEISQLNTEIDRVAETTKFNELYLLKGDSGTKTIKAKAHDAGLNGTLSDQGDTATFSIELTTDSDISISSHNYHIYDEDKDTLSTLQGKVDLADEVVINGTTYKKDDSNSTKVSSTASASIAALKTSAAALQTKAASQTTKAATKSESAAKQTSSAALKNGSAAKAQASAEKKAASAQNLSAKATSLSAKAACLEGKAAELKGSADKMAASAASLTEQANGKLDAAKAISKAQAGVVDGEIKFLSDGKEYLASELKALIVDGANVGIDGEKSRTAVDTNNKNNKTLDEMKGLIKDALKQANQIGVDDETAVGISDAKQVGDSYTYTITKGSMEVANAKSFELHVGADADLTNKITVSIETMNSKYLGVQNLNVVDDSGVAATYAVDAIEDAITKVNEQRSALGAVQNRLEHTISNLDNVVENTQSAESQIRDTDMASEMVNYSKNNILAQAGQSMLAQANQSTQGVLSLLG